MGYYSAMVFSNPYPLYGIAFHKALRNMIKKAFLMVWQYKRPLLICLCPSMLFGVFLMGAPGFAVMEFGERIILPYLFNQPYDMHRLSADSAWPTAIILSFIMPWVMYVVLVFLRRAIPILYKSVCFTVSLLIAILLACSAYLLFFPPL
ncbi:hypothetical protein ACVBE9_06770 [Eionea flava]